MWDIICALEIWAGQVCRMAYDGCELQRGGWTLSHPGRVEVVVLGTARLAGYTVVWTQYDMEIQYIYLST